MFSSKTSSLSSRPDTPKGGKTHCLFSILGPVKKRRPQFAELIKGGPICLDLGHIHTITGDLMRNMTWTDETGTFVLKMRKTKSQSSYCSSDPYWLLWYLQGTEWKQWKSENLAAVCEELLSEFNNTIGCTSFHKDSALPQSVCLLLKIPNFPNLGWNTNLMTKFSVCQLRFREII